MVARTDSNPRWRLFVAAPVPAEAANALLSGLAPLRDRHPSARWANVEQLHATLVFLGQLPSSDAGSLTAALDAASARHGPFEVETGGAGGRVGARGGGVCWMGIEAGRHELSELALDLDRIIGSGVYAHAPPRPHITVARRIDEDLLADLRAIARDLRTSWLVDRIVLMRSHPDPGGSRYETLASRVLTADSAAA